MAQRVASSSARHATFNERSRTRVKPPLAMIPFGRLARPYSGDETRFGLGLHRPNRKEVTA